MQPYCTNSQCKKREHCKKANDTISGKKMSFFYSVERYCEQYECIHKVWRKYISENHKECDNCHTIEPLFNNPEIQHQR
jgi:hypothetical protein